MRFSLDAHLRLVMTQDMPEIDMEISVLVQHDIIVVSIPNPCEIHEHHVLSQRGSEPFTHLFNTVLQMLVSLLRFENPWRVEAEHLFLSLSLELERLIAHCGVGNEIFLDGEVVEQNALRCVDFVQQTVRF